MTSALFLADFDNPAAGAQIALTGDELHHALKVRRIAAGEEILIANGRGTAVRGPFDGSQGIAVVEVLQSPEQRVNYTCVQALPKGERAELAAAMLTEAGIAQIVPWQAERSVVVWRGERAEKGLRRWRAAAREAAKQSRRFRIPDVAELADTEAVCGRIAAAGLALALHEDAEIPLPEAVAGFAPVPGETAPEVLFIVGPEGGIAPAELEAFTAAGAVPVSLGPGVLRTSTAGVFALAQLQAVLGV
ncbi:MAG: 16S rRNA (uracil(1498)-N(3))-methyltransferase [Propionibacteriaceae bacterium]|nr:16S rRNA (uracil(1498)-N(3))-methyltransferase [Propionibacteriaceae bacterium]